MAQTDYYWPGGAPVHVHTSTGVVTIQPGERVPPGAELDTWAAAACAPADHDYAPPDTTTDDAATETTDDSDVSDSDIGDE